MKNLLSVFIKIFSFGIVCSFLLLSCQIGLGASVDTEAPTVEITYPPSNVAVRSEFTLAGNCADDKEVNGIEVSVENTDTGISYGSFKAELSSNKKTWSVNLNSASTGNGSVNGWSFPDGTYEFVAVASDAAAHTSGNVTRTLEIDNSAPIFIIQSPAVTDLSKAKAYGSIFYISGEIAEDHTVSSMVVNVYDSTGTLINSEPYSADDVETAGGTDVTIAKHIATGTEEINKRYAEIYGTSSGTISYYCTVELIDSTKSYTDPDEKTNATLGNSTTSLYLYDDVYSTVVSDKNGGYGLTISSIKDILVGRISGETEVGTSSSKTTASNVMAFLNEHETDTSSTKLAFSLNPDASPRYVVRGYALPTSLSDIVTAEKKSTIYVDVSAGLDGVLVEPNTLKAYIKSYSSISDSSVYSDFLNDPATYGTEFANNSDYVSTSTDSYTWTVTLPNSILTDVYYLIAVTGNDKDLSALASDSTYGFLGAVSGVPPKITIDTPAELSFTASSDEISFTGIASSTVATVETVSCEINVTDETKTSVDSGYSIGTISGSATLNGTEWSFVPSTAENVTGYEVCKSLNNSGKRYLYSATFTAKDDNGNTITATRNIHVDSASPVVTISSVTPTVTSGSVKNVNGNISLSANVEESNLENVSYEVFIADGETAV